jgi:hypothetical protein
MLLACVALGSLPLARDAAAHEVRPAIATITIQGAQARVELSLNLEAALAGIGTDHSDTGNSPQSSQYERLRALSAAELHADLLARSDRMTGRLELLTDAGAVPFTLLDARIPDDVDPSLPRISELSLAGLLPEGAREFRWRYDAALGDSVIRVQRAGTIVDSDFVPGGGTSAAFALDANASRGAEPVLWRYLQVGFIHIVPMGLDHILFVVGLFLLSARLSALLAQVTAFTLAHTLTLGVAAAGLISLPASVVEPLIALSIVYVAVENLLTDQVRPWRLMLVFLFGLLHGLGFAGILQDIGPASGQFLLSLAAFNVGVEFGQLAVIAACFAVLGWTAGRPWRHQYVVAPASVVIGIVGMGWFVQRVME